MTSRGNTESEKERKKKKGSGSRDKGRRNERMATAWLQLPNYDWRFLRLRNQLNDILYFFFLALQSFPPLFFFIFDRQGNTKTHWFAIERRAKTERKERVESGERKKTKTKYRKKRERKKTGNNPSKKKRRGRSSGSAKEKQTKKVLNQKETLCCLHLLLLQLLLRPQLIVYYYRYRAFDLEMNEAKQEREKGNKKDIDSSTARPFRRLSSFISFRNLKEKTILSDPKHQRKERNIPQNLEGSGRNDHILSSNHLTDDDQQYNRYQ